MNPRAGTSAGRILAQLADHLAARGHDAEQLCRSVGLNLSVLRAPDTFVPVALAERLGNAAVSLSGDPNLGLDLAQSTGDAGTFDAGMLMMMASATLGESLTRMERYQRYWGDGSHFSVLPSPEGARIRYEQPGVGGAYQRHSDECALAKVVHGMRALSGAPLSPIHVRFRHGAPADTSAHEALFACTIAFDGEHTELTLSERTLQTPLPHANAAYQAIFQRQVEHALARLSGKSGLAEDVRAIARATLASGDCSLVETARVLKISARTLQRRLQNEGTSFAELVDALRSELARLYLAENVPSAEIAWLLGYGEPSAFYHAFRRWTGETPEEARRSARALG